MDNFPCTKCGLCCKNVSNIFKNTESLPQNLQDLISVFPYRPKPDGSCPMLSDDGICTVYHDRPIICNINLTAKLLNIDINDWYRINADACNQMIQKAGLSSDYLVKIEESSEKITETYEEGRIGPRKRRSRKNSKKIR